MRPDGLAVPALDGALNLCCREEEERRLFERSEFASSPSLRQKFKESFAISSAPFFAYFLWQDKESESAPAGDETKDAPAKQNKVLNPRSPNTTTGDPSPFLQETKT
jgi:hypothetical protein